MANDEPSGDVRRLDAGREVRSLVWAGDTLIDWAVGARFEMDGRVVVSGREWPGSFDAAVSTPDGEWAVVYGRLGTEAVLLRHGARVRELKRSDYHANAFEYPVCVWRHHGRVLLCHCPEAYNQIEIDDAETGERLTGASAREPQDFFHSRIQASPGGAWLLSAGWVWHPWDAVAVFNVEASLADPSQLDRLVLGAAQSRHIGLAEESSACWCSPTSILLGASEEEEDPEEAAEHPGPRLRSRGIARLDLRSEQVTADVKLDRPPGNMMPVGDAHVLCLYEHPRLVNLSNGKVEREWPELDTGSQTSSIINRKTLPPPTALDPASRRIAVASGSTIYVLHVGDVAS